MASPVWAAVLISLGGASSNFLLGAAWGTCIDVGTNPVGRVERRHEHVGQIGAILSPSLVAVIVTYVSNWSAPLYLTGVLFLCGASAGCGSIPRAGRGLRRSQDSDHWPHTPTHRANALQMSSTRACTGLSASSTSAFGWLFEGAELVRENRRAREVPGPRRQSLTQQRQGSRAKEHPPDVRHMFRKHRRYASRSAEQPITAFAPRPESSAMSSRNRQAMASGRRPSAACPADLLDIRQQGAGRRRRRTSSRPRPRARGRPSFCRHPTHP